MTWRMFLAAVSAVVICSSCRSLCRRASPGAPGGEGASSRVFATPPAPGSDLGAPGAFSHRATGHPRLWIREADLDRLRRWATPSNPIYASGLARVALSARADIDAGKIPSQGECAAGGKPCESYALLMAFLSLVDPSQAERQEYARRARTVLMHMMDRVVANNPGDPLAQPRFSLSDRSRWSGEAFALTVDWIYPHLNATDKATIRKVFLRWSEEQLHATVTNHNHPKPVGLLNDPKLVEDRSARRYAANNYFAAHARNLTLMALALDEPDDPAEEGTGRTYPRLRDYLRNATGAWLYMIDHVLANDARGGVAPEGFEYAPRTLAFVLQAYLALETAGEAAPERHGSQVLWRNNPFWKDLVPAFLHMLSPGPTTRIQDEPSYYEPAWTGDGERFQLLDFVDVFAPLGLSAALHGDRSLLEATRWIQTHTPVGGQGQLLRRASARDGSLGYRQSILYFLLFDPSAPPPADPRGSIPLEHFGTGLGQVFARTSWGPDAAWFTYQLSWAHIDHQHGDGNSFSFYRNGEWLTKERVGYGHHFEASDQHNTVSLENDRPNHTGDDRRRGFWERGSQWFLSHTDDPRVVAHSFQSSFVYVLGDATGLYNSAYENVTDVRHASRSIVWLKPDALVVYDRASTGQDGRFKRFVVHTPQAASVEGDTAIAATPRGQKLFVRALLPENPVLRSSTYTMNAPWPKTPAVGEPMAGDLTVEPPQIPRDTRFLHVLQGVDAGSGPAPTQLLRSQDGSRYEGALVGTTAVLFPVTLDVVSETTVSVPPSTSRVIVTGLRPSGRYAARLASGQVRIGAGSEKQADSGGVIHLP